MKHRYGKRFVAAGAASLSLAAVSLVLTGAQNPPAGAKPLPLRNANFEAQEGALDGWTFWSRTGDGGAEAVDGRNGGRAIRIRYPGERDWAFSSSTRFPVKPGQVYTVTSWVKGDGSVEMAVVALSGGKTLQWAIGSDGSAGSKDWKQLVAVAEVPEQCDEIYVRFLGSKTDVTVDDIEIREGAPPRPVKPAVNGFARERIREKLDRGLVALPTAGGVYVGWRLLDSDPAGTAFHVYRRAGKEKPVRLTTEPIAQTTDFTDRSAPEGELRYTVRAVSGGREGAESDAAPVTRGEARSYLSLKLPPDQTFQKVGIADLDGDGKLDYVLKQPNTNIDPYKEYWKRSPGTYTLTAVRHDGRTLWTYDIGWAIEQGIWYSPYMVYDFDGDGRAEVAVKRGEGDPRDADGKVTSGPEYVAILDGRTGKERTRVDWPSRDGYPDYNYYSRNQLGVAYLDGKTPCLIVERGTYNTIKIVAYQFRNNKLETLWAWNDREERGRFRGQGAHCLRAADVDADGCDEVIYGSAVLDDNGVGLWSTGMGHPDHVTVGDLDPMRPGLEVQYGLEIAQQRNGICMVDARTGKILWGLDESTKHIHSSGLCADLDPAHPGVESYGGERDSPEKRWLFSSTGTLISTKDMGGLAPRAVYWDADTQRELIRGGQAQELDGNKHEPKFEGSIVAIADIVGDWREEVVTTLAGEMRIYSTTVPAKDRRVTLLQDPIYRLDVSSLAQGYWQVPGMLTLPGFPTPVAYRR